MSKKKKNTKVESNNHFLNIVIIIGLLIVGLVLYARYVGNTGVYTKEYKVESKNIPKSFSGIKIIHISDIYYGSTTYKNELNQIVNKINELKPDLIVFTGDLLDPTYKLSDKEKTTIINALNNLDTNLGKYLVIGESDYENDNYNDIIKSTDFITLNNSYDLIYNEGMTPIFLGGTTTSLKDTIDYDKLFEYYNDKKEKTYEAKYKIILTHEPDNTVDILNFDNSVNLILSGHSFNGNINIPYYGGIYVREGSKKYLNEHYKINNTDLYISNGLGTDSFHYRLLNRPSFNLYRLKAL